MVGLYLVSLYWFSNALSSRCGGKFVILSGVGYGPYEPTVHMTVDLYYQCILSLWFLNYLNGCTLLSIKLYNLNMTTLKVAPENFRILCESSDFFSGWHRFESYKCKDKPTEKVSSNRYSNIQNKGNRKSKKKSRRKRWRNGREKKKKCKKKINKRHKGKNKKKKTNITSINMTIGKFKLKVRVPSLLGCPGKAFCTVTEEDWICSLRHLSSLQGDCEICSVHPVALYHIGLYLGSDRLINIALCTLIPKDAPYFLKHISDPEHCTYVQNIINQYDDGFTFAYLPPQLRRNIFLLSIWSSVSLWRMFFHVIIPTYNVLYISNVQDLVYCKT